MPDHSALASAESHPLQRLPGAAHARVVGAYARTAVETAQSLGVDLTALAQACDWPALAAQPLQLPEALPVDRYIAFLHEAALQLGHRRFGLEVGRRMQLSTFASYGLVLCACPDVRSALVQTQRFEGLAHDLGRSELSVEGDTAVYRWHSPWLDRPGADQLVESVMMGIYSFGHWLVGRQLPLSQLRFAHVPSEADTAAWYGQLLGVPVEFGAAITEARFPAALLDLPLANADASMFPALAQAAEARLSARLRETQEPALVQALRQDIAAQLMQGRATLALLAESRQLSARSLQRRLAESGHSFSQLLDEVRKELAQRYLRQPELSLTDVAFLLGFSEQSNFNHAFKLWFGASPAAWRAQQR
ncbi:AraC family transcriptional regulator [Pelomonas sp. BJYL3]|uniref:AraC family transcriptional regulator n=1 Tax=Pelomonas sp. BJYL3 TaxID=2976697 RepID=UPI0022B3CFA0|nr:AraC family transcriptional regulator [Pelomonas sp. BJYL3]